MVPEYAEGTTQQQGRAWEEEAHETLESVFGRVVFGEMG